jgi:hypothetical protein
MNRATTAAIKSFEKAGYPLFGRILFTEPSATIVPVLQVPNFGAGGNTWVTAGSGGLQGFASVTRNSAGDFTITLQDNYVRLIGASFTYDNPASVGLPAAPLVALKADGTNMAASGGATVEFTTSAEVVGGTSSSTFTPGGAALVHTLSGFTGTSSSTVTTITSGGATVAAHALAGSPITDGTTSTTIVDNTALTATTGTITTALGLASTITATGNAWLLRGTVSTTPSPTSTNTATDPAQNEVLYVTLFLGDSSSY